MIYTFCKSKNKILRTLSVIDFSFFLLMGTFSNLTKTIYQNSSKFFEIVNSQDIYGNSIALPNLICLAIILFVSLSLIYLLYEVFDHKLEYPLILIVGFASRIMMGFSPTIFASCSRTAIILYFSALVLSLIIYRELYNDKNIKEKKIIESLNYLIVILAIGQYFDEIFSLI